MRNFGIIMSFLLLVSCNSNKMEYVIGVGERIHHDDFEYSVTDYIVTRFLKNGNDTLKAKGMFYLATFKVENKAMRVNHNWNNSVAYIIDGKGNIYENQKDVQQYFEKINPFGLKETYNTMAGGSDSTILAFDLPFGVTKPYLRVRGEILMGDVFDKARFRKMIVKLF